MVFSSSPVAGRTARFLLAACILFGVASIPSVSRVQAEGTANLTTDAIGGDRPFLEYRDSTNLKGTSAGILRRTIIKVYAKDGEQILLGSSATGIGQGKISYRAPSTILGKVSELQDCPTNVGRILSRDQERKGPNEAAGGYTPCVIPIDVDASQAGVWEIYFVSPSPANSEDPKLEAGPVNNNWNIDPKATNPKDQPASASWVRAWDVTVRNKTTKANIDGRVFTNYLALNMGGNDLALNSKFYIQTDDGYQYLVDLNGLDPYGFIFFSNNNGFKEAGKQTPVYKSVQLAGINPNYTIPDTVTLHSPDSPDTSADITHKIFFSKPNDDLPPEAATPNGTITWLKKPTSVPRAPTNLTFTGSRGTPNEAVVGEGGTFSFENTETIRRRYTLQIDLNNDKEYGGDGDIDLTGEAEPGLNTRIWDGKDTAEKIIPPGDVTYGVRVTFNGGEVHFPFIDPENNPDGFKIERQTHQDLEPEPSIVYYNDTEPLPKSTEPPTTTIKTDGKPPFPLDGRGGVSTKVTGAQAFEGKTNYGYGDGKGIDSWTYLASRFELAGMIRIVGQPTAIQLASFTATKQADGATRLRWTTSSETNTYGFNLYRSATSDRASAVKVNPTLIRASGSGQGATYTYVDAGTDGTPATYWLQEIELNGVSHEYRLVDPSSAGATRIFVPLARR